MAEKRRLVYVKAGNLSRSRKRRSKELQQECFSRVGRREVTERFIAKRFGWVFAYRGKRIAGQVELFSRNVVFEGRRILVGGLAAALA